MQALSLPRFWRAASALSLLAVAGVASVEYDFSVPTTSTGWTSLQSLSRFNPSLGTLLSVDFGLSDNMTTTVELSNMSPTAGQTNTVTNVTTGTFSIKDSGASTTYLSGNLAVTKSGTYAANGQMATDYASPYGQIFSPVNLNGTFAQSYTDLSTLNSFTGLSPISLLIGAKAISTTTGTNGNTLGANITTADANGFVRYNFQPVPEPTSCAALAIGAVAMLRRRKAGAR